MAEKIDPTIDTSMDNINPWWVVLFIFIIGLGYLWVFGIVVYVLVKILEFVQSIVGGG